MSLQDLFMHIYKRKPSQEEAKNYMYLERDEALRKVFADYIGSWPPGLSCSHDTQIFIPRDAGFFSVFNFLMGLLYMGTKAYPYYNKQVFMMRNGVNKHFCYWTDKENAWMDYFMPLDDEHEDITKSMYKDDARRVKIVSGEDAPCEFRSPFFIKMLMTNRDLWSLWRHRVHDVYNKHIRVTDKIQERVDRFWKANVDSSGHKHYVIGVHFRHPSHYVEGGKIFFADYFRKIEQIINTIPDTDIYVKIFIASDTEWGIMAFKHHYKWVSPFYMQDIERCSVDNLLEWGYARGEGKSDDMDFINGVGYQYHYTKCAGQEFNARHGQDVLCEVLALSRCDCVVHTVSNIALAVSYMNPNIEMHPIVT